MIIFNGSAIVHTSSSRKIREQGRGDKTDYEREREKEIRRERIYKKHINAKTIFFIFTISAMETGFVGMHCAFTFF